MYQSLRKYIKEILSPHYVGMSRSVQSDLQRNLTPVRTQTQGILGTHNKPEIYASCVVIMRKDGKFLGVSRKNDHSDFGFPGGHIEDGESPEGAAIRELQEETGLIATNLHYLMKVPTKSGGFCAVFLCKAKGKIHTEEEGVVKWVTQEDLLDGSFGDQNFLVLKKLGLQI